MATDMMVWNITKEKVTERMAVSADGAFAVAGPTRQPAQKELLDKHMKKYNLQDQDSRKQKPWYKPTK